jgi:hypothetical protein
MSQDYLSQPDIDAFKAAVKSASAARELIISTLGQEEYSASGLGWPREIHDYILDCCSSADTITKKFLRKLSFKKITAEKAIELYNAIKSRLDYALKLSRMLLAAQDNNDYSALEEEYNKLQETKVHPPGDGSGIRLVNGLGQDISQLPRNPRHPPKPKVSKKKKVEDKHTTIIFEDSEEDRIII